MDIRLIMETLKTIRGDGGDRIAYIEFYADDSTDPDPVSIRGAIVIDDMNRPGDDVRSFEDIATLMHLLGKLAGTNADRIS